MNKKHVVIFVGTRPEALKLVVLYLLLKQAGVRVTLCATGQHSELIGKALEPFGVLPDQCIELERKGSDLCELSSLLFHKIGEFLDRSQPTLCIVQGDTTTALVAGMASFYKKIPVIHVEAGLRTSGIDLPFPEEFNRRLISQFSALDFAPTVSTYQQLIAEGKKPDDVYEVGNTIVDAMFYVVEQLKDSGYRDQFVSKEVSALTKLENLILFTCHRRENIGQPMKDIAWALHEIATSRNCNIVFPYHPNPVVYKTFNSILGGLANVHFIPAQNYPSFIELQQRSKLVITDSGGVQEECASLGIPFVVIRDETERPEALLKPELQLVGANTQRVISVIEDLLSNQSLYDELTVKRFPFGDGTSSRKIVQVLRDRAMI